MLTAGPMGSALADGSTLLHPRRRLPCRTSAHGVPRSDSRSRSPAAFFVYLALRGSGQMAVIVAGPSRHRSRAFREPRHRGHRRRRARHHARRRERRHGDRRHHRFPFERLSDHRVDRNRLARARRTSRCYGEPISSRAASTAARNGRVGRLLPAVASKNPRWIGRITGLALAVRGPIGEPMRIVASSRKPAAPWKRCRSVREWIAFERWSGTSINTVTGGADVQDLPLPLTARRAALIAAASLVWRATQQLSATHPALPAVVAGLFVVAWFVLDAHWMFNLARQVDDNRARYRRQGLARRAPRRPRTARCSRSSRRRAPKMPTTPARVFVVADAALLSRPRRLSPVSAQRVFRSASTTPFRRLRQLRPGDLHRRYQRRGVAIRRRAAASCAGKAATGRGGSSAGRSRRRVVLGFDEAATVPDDHAPRSTAGRGSPGCRLVLLLAVRPATCCDRAPAKSRGSIGAGYLAGAFLLTLWMRVLSAVGIRFSFAAVALPLAVATHRLAALSALVDWPTGVALPGVCAR